MGNDIPEFTQEMLDAGAVYLGRGQSERSGPAVVSWRNRGNEKGWQGKSWFISSPHAHYAIHPDDPNFEQVCREFGVDPYPELTDLTACGPLSPEFGAEFERNVNRLAQERAEAARKRTLPTGSAERKEYPMFRGLLRYFPAALAGVARHSKAGNDKHNPGQELHHARGKSTDHADCIIRHLVDMEDLMEQPGDIQDVLDEANALAWRALALSQEIHEKYGGAPMAPGAEE